MKLMPSMSLSIYLSVHSQSSQIRKNENTHTHNQVSDDNAVESCRVEFQFSTE
jgi:hypothetical protein